MLFVLLSVSVMAVDDIYTRSSAVIDVNVSGLVVARSKTPYDSLDYLVVDMDFFPKNDVGQRVQGLSTSVPAQVMTDKIRWRWDAPVNKEFVYGVSSRVEVFSNFGIFSKVGFPIDELKIPSSAKIFLEPTELIDSDSPVVRTLAGNLARGEKDLWSLVSKVGVWVRENVRYNLSTLDLPVSKSASWVIASREGVCAELTTLFVAILRSLGVPARFVSGVAFTDSPLFPGGWGGHAWAEVFFPDSGWVPFDVTFGEFGWINPGHVKMLVSKDAGDPSTKFQWRGKNVELALEPLKISADVFSLAVADAPFVRIGLSVGKNRVGAGSYSLLVLDVENLRNSFQTIEFKLADVRELVSDEKSKYILLSPREKKREFWIVQVSPELKSGYLYEIPLMVYTSHNESARSVIYAKDDGFVYSLGDIMKEQSVLSQQTEQEFVSCLPSKQFMYSYERIAVVCSFKQVADNAVLCLSNCINISSSPANITLEFGQPGLQEFMATVKSSGFSAVSSFSVEMLDVPDIALRSLSFPQTASYRSSHDVQVVLDKLSVSDPEQVKIVLSWSGISQVVEFDRLVDDQPVSFVVSGGDLGRKRTFMVLEVSWKDRNGRVYASSERFQILTVDVGFFRGFWLFFVEFAQSIAGAFS